jgi:hypothetical protein
VISSSSAVASGSASVSLTRLPRRWRQTWPRISGTLRAKASPPRSTSEAASLIRVRSLPLGGRARCHPRTAQPRERSPQTAHSGGVHHPRSDRTGRYGAAARDRAAHGLGRRVQGSPPAPFFATTALLRTTRHQPASSPDKRVRPGRVDPVVLRDRRARLRGMAEYRRASRRPASRRGRTCRPCWSTRFGARSVGMLRSLRSACSAVGARH